MPDSLPAVQVGLLPPLCPPGRLPGACAVVVDILRASTTICRALEAGATRIRTCVEIDQARQLAEQEPPRALLMGERGGLPIPGFDLGNSPRECTPERVAGRALVMTTTNGTRAIEYCRPADRLLIGSFNNFQAVLRAVLAWPRIMIACAGTNEAISREDTLYAGALCQALHERGYALDNDQALLAQAAWAQVADQPLAIELRNTQGGRNLTRIQMESDIDEAAQWDRTSCLPVYRADRGVIMRSDS